MIEYVRSLKAEATAENERRLLVLTGDRERNYTTLERLLGALEVPITETTLVGPEDRLRCPQVPESAAGSLLGTTRELVVLDAHAGVHPNTIGRLVGTVDGGGLFVLLLSPLERWPLESGAFEESMAIPPFDVDAVGTRFRHRVLETLRTHRGIAIWDTEMEHLLEDGRTYPAPRLAESRPPRNPPATESTHPQARSGDELDLEELSERSGTAAIAQAAVDACLTGDQQVALETLASLIQPETAVVLEADRGRGKSSALGLAGAWLAASGFDVAVTAPDSRNVDEVFTRAHALLEPTDLTGRTDEQDSSLEIEGSGRLRYLDPVDVQQASPNVDILFVDEAAAFPVALLESFLAADRVAFATTIHGYEGAGRGFSVRFRDRLEGSTHTLYEYTLTDPIRYAAGDPLEVWSFHALLLDARPPVMAVVREATPETVQYRHLDAPTLRSDPALLSQVFGLLVLAHYRTEPNDLARMLDAPNLSVRALTHDGFPVSVALLAREGALEESHRALMYEGGRIRGNMIPDILTSHLRDEDAGSQRGIRVVRIATHHGVRSQGLGSALLKHIEAEFGPTVDWLGAGFGATPELLEFWGTNGYRPIHFSTTRNDTSGEHSAIVLKPQSLEGDTLIDDHANAFVERLPAVLTDALQSVSPDLVRSVTGALGPTYAPPLACSSMDWEFLAGAAYGPVQFDIHPAPFADLVLTYLFERPPAASGSLTATEERLLVARALQRRDWNAIATEFEYPSTRTCKRAFGDALEPLVDWYGGETAAAVRARFTE